MSYPDPHTHPVTFTHDTPGTVPTAITITHAHPSVYPTTHRHALTAIAHPVRGQRGGAAEVPAGDSDTAPGPSIYRAIRGASAQP